MSEQPTPPTPTPSAQPPAGDSPKAPETPPQTFTQEDLDRILADRLRRAKPADYDDLKAKADRLAEIEDAQKSEQQRHADAAAAAQRERDEARSEALRYKAAATHKVDSDYFDLLGSGSEEQIVQRAERVGTLLAENAQMKAELEALRAGKPAPTSGTPVAALKPGATPEANKTEDDVLYERLFGV